jgi:arylsulfatase
MSGSEPRFGGRIGRTLADSEPRWPEPPSPPGAAPNVVMMVLDDTGFAHLVVLRLDDRDIEHRPARAPA